jgi:hypothetical protein
VAAIIRNRSTVPVWIFGDDAQHELPPDTTSREIAIRDADGLLLDGRPVFFDSRRNDLGGGQIYSLGAIKVCDLGTMTITDSAIPVYRLRVVISILGFLCPGKAAGYCTVEWCTGQPGWLRLP